MTELLIFLLTLLGFDTGSTPAPAAVVLQQRTKAATVVVVPQQSKSSGRVGLGTGAGSIGKTDAGGSRGGGSRQIGGPVIVFDDVMFKPVGN